MLTLALLLACASEPPPPPPEGPFRLTWTDPRGVVRSTTEAEAAEVLPYGLGAVWVTPSPDGSRLAFLRPIEATDCALVRHAELWTAGPEGEHLLASAAERGSAAWSPDGSTLVWASSEGDPDSCGQTYLASKRLRAAAPDGSGLRVIAPTKKAVTDGEPAWSPDGAKIAFIRDGELYTVTPGKEPIRLTDSERRAAMASPIWSPDGRWLVFEVLRGDPRKSEIWRLPAGGAEHELLHDGGALDRPVAWSWDGATILLESTSWAGDVPDAAIVALDVASGVRTVLAPDPAADLSPQLSPDGKTVVFSSDRGGLPGLWRVGLDGSDLRMVTPAATSPARWSR